MSQPRRKVPTIGVTDFASRFPDKALELDEELSGCTAQEFTYGARMVMWWKCPTGLHSYPSTPNQRSSFNSGCVYCSGHKVLRGFNDLATCKAKLVEECWDWKRNSLSPYEMTAESNCKVWWICSCGNRVFSSPNSRPDRCKYCMNQVLLKGFNDLQTLHPELANLWHPTKNGDLTAADVLGGGKKRTYWWRCLKGHERRITVKHALNRGCPRCANHTSKAEIEINDHLESNGITTVMSLRILDGKEIDVFLPEYNVGIEFNGSWWHSEEKGTPKMYHYEKWKCAKSKGIDLLFVDQIEYEANPSIIDDLIEALGTTECRLPTDPVRNGTLDEVVLSRCKHTRVRVLPPSAKLVNLNTKEYVSSRAAADPDHTLVTHWDAGASVFGRMTEQRMSSWEISPHSSTEPLKKG